MKTNKALLPLLQLHIDCWKDCTKCNLTDERSQVLFFTGEVPCETLFVGLRPTDQCDALNGPLHPNSDHGRIYEKIFPRNSTWAYTNLISCYGSQPPEDSQKLACFSKFLGLVELANPGMIVCVGKETHGYVLNYLNDIIKKLSRRIICIGLPAPFFIQCQKDQNLEIAKASLNVEAVIEKYFPLNPKLPGLF